MQTGRPSAFAGSTTRPTTCSRRTGRRYANYTGCGNTLNANHPVVRRMIVDSLRYWVNEMHVDGFRFDLASILSRDPTGQPLPNPPVLWDIEIGSGARRNQADCRGVGRRRACTRSGPSSATRGRNGTAVSATTSATSSAASQGRCGRFADRLVGSPEMYGHKGREAEQSVNFVTCHDGFTLNDLVSYNSKHNEANGEQNRDGADDNRSWNCGVEGPTDDPAVEGLRNRQVKNFLTVTLLVARPAHDPDGRRGATHAGRQQQRLLPRRRVDVVRLVARRETRGCASVRRPARGASSAA